MTGDGPTQGSSPFHWLNTTPDGSDFILEQWEFFSQRMTAELTERFLLDSNEAGRRTTEITQELVSDDNMSAVPLQQTPGLSFFSPGNRVPEGITDLENHQATTFLHQ